MSRVKNNINTQSVEKSLKERSSKRSKKEKASVLGSSKSGKQTTKVESSAKKKRKKKSGTAKYLEAIGKMDIQTAKTLPKQPSIIDQSTAVSLFCPICLKQRPSDMVVRMKSRKKMSPKMQKIFRRRSDNQASVTAHQERLLQKCLKSQNVLVLKCKLCGWKGESLLQTRAAFNRQRERLNQESEQVEVVLVDEKKANKKTRKKQMRKRAAEMNSSEHIRQRHSKEPSKDADLISTSPSEAGASSSRKAAETNLSQQTPKSFPRMEKSLSQSSNNSISAKTALPLRKPNNMNSGACAVKRITPTFPKLAQLQGKTPVGLQNSGSRKGKGKQSLKAILDQKTKAPPSAAESLSNFLNSLT